MAAEQVVIAVLAVAAVGLALAVWGTRRRQELSGWRIEAAAREAGFRRLVENASDVIFITVPGEALTMSYVSPAIRQLTGYPQSAWIKDPGRWRDIVHEDDLPLLDDLMASGTEPVHPIRIHHRDGGARWIEIRSTAHRDVAGRVTTIEGIMRDVTAQVELEHVLRESLEKEQAVVTELRRIDHMKDTFLAAVSHELRTPLAAVLGFALTLDRDGERMTAEQRRLLHQRIAKNARRLEQLVADLLDLDRLTRGIIEPNRRTVDLHALTGSVTTGLEATGRRLVLAGTSAVVEADPAMIERVVENLIGNALKHTSAENTVWVRTEQDGDEDALLSVEDDGAGVPADERERIFEPFVQGSNRLDHSPGTGIGLSLVRQFVALHGGDVWVEDRPGGGAAFRVRLPRTPPQTDATPSA